MDFVQNVFNCDVRFQDKDKTPSLNRKVKLLTEDNSSVILDYTYHNLLRVGR